MLSCSCVYVFMYVCMFVCMYVCIMCVCLERWPCGYIDRCECVYCNKRTVNVNLRFVISDRANLLARCTV